MSAVDVALPRLKVEEGFRASAYRDTNGKLTIGYGFCVDAGISPRAALALLQVQAQERHEQLLSYPWYAALNDARQSVCLDIAFNEGIGGLLHFPKMIAALTLENWTVAATECTVTDPRLKSRYDKLAQILLAGTAV